MARRQLLFDRGHTGEGGRGVECLGLAQPASTSQAWSSCVAKMNFIDGFWGFIDLLAGLLN